jgi:hypothetical protein
MVHYRNDGYGRHKVRFHCIHYILLYPMHCIQLYRVKFKTTWNPIQDNLKPNPRQIETQSKTTWNPIQDKLKPNPRQPETQSKTTWNPIQDNLKPNSATIRNPTQQQLETQLSNN